jgi:S1-C subfamily serine protease
MVSVKENRLWIDSRRSSRLPALGGSPYGNPCTFFFLNDDPSRSTPVVAGGPGAAAGLQPGDLLLAFDQVTVNGIDDLHRSLTAEMP